jgi:hypothetical protein
MIQLRMRHLAPLLLAVVGCDPQVDPDYQGEPLGTLRGSVNSTEQSQQDADVAVLWLVSTDAAECSGPAPSCSAGLGGDDTTDWDCLDACVEPDSCDEELLAQWAACSEACDGVVEVDYSVDFEFCANGAEGERVAVEGDFPSLFTLDLFGPPPANALLAGLDAEPSVAVGFLVVGAKDASLKFDFEADDPPTGLIGGSEGHLLIYADGPIAADSAWGTLLGGSYSEGYHVVTVIDGGSDCDENPPPPGVDPNEYCGYYPDTLMPSPDDLETAITLKIAPFDEIDWPFF